MNMLRKFILETAREQWAANMRSRHTTETESDLARLAIAECDKMLFEMIPVEKPTPRGTPLGELAAWDHFDKITKPKEPPLMPRPDDRILDKE